MKRSTAILILALILAVGLTILQDSSPASSRALMAITLTPTDRPPDPRTPQPTPPPGEEPPGYLPRTGLGVFVQQDPATPNPLETTNHLAAVDPLQKLVIPSLNVTSDIIPIYLKGKEWDISNLGVKTGWLESVAHPAQNNNTVLVAHLNLIGYGPGPFQRLARLTPGATVQLYTAHYIYTYQVRSQRVVDETDVSVVSRTSTPQLTMITCSGWDESKQDYLKRLVATADLVSKQIITSPGIRLRKYYFYAE